MMSRDELLDQLHRDFPVRVLNSLEDYLPLGDNYVGSDDPDSDEPARIRAAAERAWAGIRTVASRPADAWEAKPTDDDQEVMLLAQHLLDVFPPQVRLGFFPLCFEEYIWYGHYCMCDISLNHLAVDFLQRELLSEQQQATLLEVWCWLSEPGHSVFDVAFAWMFRIANSRIIRPETARFIKDRYAQTAREMTAKTAGGRGSCRSPGLMRRLTAWIHGGKSQAWTTDLERVATMNDREIADWFRNVYAWCGPGNYGDRPPSLETLTPGSIRSRVRQICERAAG